MTVLEEVGRFSAQFGRDVVVERTVWRYYRLGVGPPIFWLTGGLRRGALGFAFLERLAAHHTVIAPDFPPVQTIDEFIVAFDAILLAEGIASFALGGQSYGGLLAQAYLAHRPEDVDRLILSSSGPADSGRAWLPAEHALIALARLLPEKTAKKLLVGGLLKAITLPGATHDDWARAITVVVQDELTRADVVSHFAVAADLIRKRSVAPAAFAGWPGRVSVLSAENDPMQGKKDVHRYERLFGRPVEVLSLGLMGHAAALFDPDGYVDVLERALA